MMIQPTACVSIVLLLAILNLAWSPTRVGADDRKTTGELIKSRGFDYDEFDVISQGYILKAYRIINPLADPRRLNKIPVVAHHGINFDLKNMMSSSQLSRPRRPRVDERVTLYATENGTDDRGLHFYLSNNNYDVWLVQARGVNEQVMRRLKGRHRKSFWDFSIDEQALIDLPIQIEFVLKKTGAPKVAYVAYSQSTTLMFALLSMRPQFAEKLATFIAVAPVVFAGHMKGVLWPIVLSKIYFHTTTARENVPEWLRTINNYISTYFCSISYIKNTICRKIWEQYSGPTKNAHLEGGMVDDVLKATSMKTFEQYLQNALSKDFRMYDYKDEQRNMEEYGQTVPPGYNVSKICLKTIALFRGTADYLSDPQDQMILLSRLRVPIYEDHILEDYSHIDFITSPTVTRDINEPILRIIDKLTGRPVKRVLHTLGNPNPQVEGTPLVLDVKKDFASVKDAIRSKVAGLDKSLPKAERPREGGTMGREDPASAPLREQLSEGFGRDFNDKSEPWASANSSN